MIDVVMINKGWFPMRAAVIGIRYLSLLGGCVWRGLTFRFRASRDYRLGA